MTWDRSINNRILLSMTDLQRLPASCNFQCPSCAHYNEGLLLLLLPVQLINSTQTCSAMSTAADSRLMTS